MADSCLRSDSDYHVLFDPKAYLGSYFFNPGGPEELIKFALECLHNIYSEGKVKGNRIIDVGSGPTIHMLIPAAKWFDELFISDFSKINIETQKKWFARDPEACEWEAFFRYFAKKDGNEEVWPHYEELLRDKIKGVLCCDFHQSNPLHPEAMGQFDAVSTSLALEPGSKDLEQYRKAMKNVVSHIAPGGHFILFAVLKNPFYVVGDEKFSCLSISFEEVLESVKETGLEVVQCLKGSCKKEGDLAPYDGGVMVLGRKKPKS